MTDNNGDGKRAPIVQIQIVANLGNGQTNTRHPNDLMLTMQILAQVMKTVAEKAARLQAEAARSKVQTAGAAALRVLPKPGDRRGGE